MNLLYRAMRVAVRFVFLQTMTIRQIGQEHPDRDGGFILAASHISHLEPVCIAAVLRREIDWMTRKEFYCNRPIAWLLTALNCFKVNRQGIPISSIREAIRRARADRVVGIFPEGGVVHGPQSVIRGGPIRNGVCSIAIHSQKPIIPCVILGTQHLTRVWPWLPLKLGRLWIIYGEPIHPRSTRSTRCEREALAREVRAAMVRMYDELRQRYGIEDSAVP